MMLENGKEIRVHLGIQAHWLNYKRWADSTIGLYDSSGGDETSYTVSHILSFQTESMFGRVLNPGSES